MKTKAFSDNVEGVGYKLECCPFLQSQNKLVLWLRMIKICCIIGIHLANRVIKYKTQRALSVSRFSYIGLYYKTGHDRSCSGKILLIE